MSKTVKYFWVAFICSTAGAFASPALAKDISGRYKATSTYCQSTIASGLASPNRDREIHLTLEQGASEADYYTTLSIGYPPGDYREAGTLHLETLSPNLSFNGNYVTDQRSAQFVVVAADNRLLISELVKERSGMCSKGDIAVSIYEKQPAK